MNPSPAPGAGRVLIVEDDASLRRLLEMRLVADGYSVRLAEDGEVALEALRGWTPDIIVSDVMMPRMSGLSLCRAVREDVRLDAIPIILLTARQFDADMQAVVELGGIAYMNKPFSAAALRDALESGLHGSAVSSVATPHHG